MPSPKGTGQDQLTSFLLTLLEAVVGAIWGFWMAVGYGAAELACYMAKNNGDNGGANEVGFALITGFLFGAVCGGLLGLVSGLWLKNMIWGREGRSVEGRRREWPSTLSHGNFNGLGKVISSRHYFALPLVVVLIQSDERLCCLAIST